LHFNSRELEQKIAHLYVELEAAQEPVARLAAALRCCLEQPPLLPKEIEPLAAKEMRRMVADLEELRAGLQFGTCVTTSELRRTEKVLLDSSVEVVSQLRKWIAVHPLVLRQWDLLEPAVNVEVRSERIRSLAISISNTSVHDTP
jgi:hypothetical protein